MVWDIIRYDETDSTNLRVKHLAGEQVCEGTVVVADCQTSGRGRRGRTWESPKGKNLYFSLLLRPELEPSKAPMLTLVMAVSAVSAVRKLTDMKAKIKWPNDLVLEKKKICGILTEMQVENEKIAHVIIGVGVNVNQEEFTEELKYSATSLYLESGRKFDRQLLLDEILNEFEKNYGTFLKYQNLGFIQETYNELLVNRDCEVKVLEPDVRYSAYALGINEKGELLVRREDGMIEAIFAGEVSVRGICGYV